MNHKFLLVVAAISVVAVLAGLGGAVPLGGVASAGPDILEVRSLLRPAGQCQDTTNPEDEPAPDDAALTLGRGQLPAAGLTFLTNPATYPTNLDTADVNSAINAALATWSAAASGSVPDLVRGATSSARRIRFDGVNLIAFGGVSKGSVAEAAVFLNATTFNVVEADIILSRSFPWAVLAGGQTCISGEAAFDLQNVMTHEVGHAVRLGDLGGSRDAAQTMFGLVAFGERYKRTLAPGDDAGADFIY